MKLRLARQPDQLYVLKMEVGPNAGKRIPRRNTWRDFDVIRRGAGFPPCSPHDLRRSCCPNLSRSMPLHVIHELAGHNDIRTPRRFDVKAQPELMDEARRVLERAVAS